MLKELEDIYIIDLCCEDDLVPYYEKLGMLKSNGMLVRNYEMQSGIKKIERKTLGYFPSVFTCYVNYQRFHVCNGCYFFMATKRNL